MSEQFISMTLVNPEDSTDVVTPANEAEHKKALKLGYVPQQAPKTTTVANSGQPRQSLPPMQPTTRAQAAARQQFRDESRASVPEWAPIGLIIEAKVTGFASNTQWDVTKWEANVNGVARKGACYFRNEHPDVGGIIRLEVRESQTAVSGKSWFTL